MSLCNDEYLEIISYCEHRSLFKFVLVNKNFNRMIHNIPLYREIVNMKTETFTYTDIIKKKSLLLTKYFYEAELGQPAFFKCCKYGRLEIAKWLYSCGNIDTCVNFDSALEISCKHGHLEMVKWLYFFDFDIHKHNYDLCFRTSCEKGHLEIAKWLYSIGVDVHKHKNDLFVECEDLEIMKWLYTFKIENRCEKEAFDRCCKFGRLEIAKWLYSCGNIDIHGDQERAFRWSCYSGHLRVAKWLYSLGNVNIHCAEHMLYYNSKYGNIHEDDVYVFIETCEKGELEVAKWLYSLYKCNISTHLINKTRQKGFLETSDWLNSLRKETSYCNIM